MSEEKARKEFHDYLDKTKRTSLSISRIPEKYKTRFLEIAKEETKGDYGMLLREMIRLWDGLFVDANEDLRQKIDLLADEVVKLQSQVKELGVEKERQSGLTVMADGSTKRLR